MVGISILINLLRCVSLMLPLSGNNSLFGQLPSELGNLENLSTLDLGVNSFEGSIPTEFGNLKALESLVIEIIGLPGEGLTGELPTELGNLENFKNIVLSKWMSLNQMYMMRKHIPRKCYALFFAHVH